jgi:hypothetical protein
MVMVGAMLAGHVESPGQIVEIDNKLYKEYYGSASNFNRGDYRFDFSLPFRHHHDHHDYHFHHFHHFLRHHSRHYLRRCCCRRRFRRLHQYIFHSHHENHKHRPWFFSSYFFILLFSHLFYFLATFRESEFLFRCGDLSVILYAKCKKICKALSPTGN